MTIRRRRSRRKSGHERWLISYADFITLLFAFFVVLYASSQADSKKAAKISASIENGFQELGVFTGGSQVSSPTPTREAAGHSAPGPDSGSAHLLEIAEKERISRASGIDVDDLRRQLESALGDEIEKHEVQMRVTPEGLVVSLREVGFFNSAESELLPAGQDTLTRIAGILGSRGFEIRVEGHTDNVPIHTSQFHSNWELSTNRATQVVSLLVERYDFNPELISAAGYAEFHPIASNLTEQGRAMNRRVDLVVVGHAPEVPVKPDARLNQSRQ